MTRYGYDCIGAVASWVRTNLPLPAVMFWYGTGSPDIQWDAADRQQYPADILVEIDQGGAGSPVMTAIVRDVENGAWAPGTATDKKGWDVERPTLYGSRDTLSQVASDGWKGDYWLAWPGWTGEALPEYPGITIIGVQDLWESNYDRTTFLDEFWPHLPPPPPVHNPVSVTIHSRTANAAFNSLENASGYKILYAETPQTAPVKIWAGPAVSNSPVTHVVNLIIPNAHGGELSFYGTIAGTDHLIGTFPVP